MKFCFLNFHFGRVQRTHMKKGPRQDLKLPIIKVI
nr:MAG TPA: hypothetical protein [Caudoviricetes sp.]